MDIFRKNKVIVTHSGVFHTDDLFATAVLSILYDGNIKIIRTRDQRVIVKADVVYDVGGEYDSEKNRFDHHQRGGAGSRPNGILYSSFGLIWETYGEKICGSKEVALRIDQKIVQPIDAHDNGIDLYVPKFDGVIPYSVEPIFLCCSPTWKEDSLNLDDIFKKEVKKVVSLLLREIEVAKADIEGNKIILEAYKKSGEKRLVVLEYALPRYLIQDVLPTLAEPLYVVYPSSHNETWKVEAVRENLNTLKSRKLFPEAWRGFLNRDPKLKEMTGVSDIIFCHASGFFINVGSKEGAIKLAQRALLEPRT